MSRHGCFTLGHVLALFWRTSQPLLPWALTSALLTVAGIWDYLTMDRPIEWVVLALGAYELMIGLLEEEPASARAECTRQ